MENYVPTFRPKESIMTSGVITSGDIYSIIRKTLGLVNEQVTEHSEIVGYMLYKMLLTENRCSGDELIDYTMVGILHDLGVFKTGQQGFVMEHETQNVWDHSIYGYLFLKYLSPLSSKADIVLYHHLYYYRHSLVSSPNLKITEYLSYADIVDIYTRLRTPDMLTLKGYIQKNLNKTVSAEAQALFAAAEKQYNIMSHIRDGSYREELRQLFALRRYTEAEKRGFLQLLIYIIDFQSEFTVLHTLGTTTFANKIAELMKLSEEEKYEIYYGALLHDIGKMLIPISILESPNRLTSEEMAIMQTHAMNTEKILRGILHEDVVQIASRHHEKMDGSGYPRGLRGDELTIPQRIVAVADILSALYQKRSYKDAFNAERIRNILISDVQNNKICPRVVKCVLENFVAIFEDFEAQKDKTMGLYLEIKAGFAEIYERFRIFDEH